MPLCTLSLILPKCLSCISVYVHYCFFPLLDVLVYTSVDHGSVSLCACVLRVIHKGRHKLYLVCVCFIKVQVIFQVDSITVVKLSSVEISIS